MALYAPEHDDLRAAVRGLLEKAADSAAVRRTVAAGGFDAALWQRMSGELGLAGLAIPEEHGGSGYGPVELGVVLEEIGRANLPSPYLTTVLAGVALSTAGAADDLLPVVAAGERLATVSFGTGWTLDGDRVTGLVDHVPDGTTADRLVLVGAPGGVVVDLAGADRRPLRTMDLTRGQARITLAGAPARPFAAPHGWAGRVGAVAAVLVACEQVGGADRVLETASAYAGERVQFGRPIGSFQAVKHLLADMLVALELARSTQQHALGLLAAPGADPAAVDAAARSARVACSRAFVQISSDAIRVLGGIGYTWEHDAHLYFRRARASAALFGAGDDLDRLATHAGLVPS
ncbi:acyl-CoA dehydrogenase [Actinomycetospora sp. NBRC 106375]|uniref:acyl-CoA dehydrogenase family protein n=1 Tax=Actinomycetospora sp. NBRC 106375 TaxID=3032207 RepID=UPI0024A1E888|nr:acyl-CoA dehydrogenase family protein [Actinomycetospora sp. NBRC 106375]GLZ49092.1 acyl-CoA dehydrogenase [Actinomycetospora sp. NBRC 106375]